MASALEVRVPFLDEDLVSFANRLPDELRFTASNFNRKIYQEGDSSVQKEVMKQSGKLALRRLAEDLVPSAAQLRKQGFSAPDSEWFRVQGRNLIEHRLCDRNNQMWEYLDFDHTQTLIHSHLSGAEKRRLLIWSLLTLESTVRQFGFLE